jgi:hypothetical protein
MVNYRANSITGISLLHNTPDRSALSTSLI